MTGRFVLDSSASLRKYSRYSMIMPTEPSAIQTDDVLFERLVFGWWNTSLSPVGIDRSDTEQRTVAGEIVKGLINDFKVDCLALGEVNGADLDFLCAYAGVESFRSFDGTLRTGRLQFDTGMIYDSNRLSIIDHKDFSGKHAGQNFKVANRVHVASSFGGDPLQIFVSHWPSQGQEQNTLTRERIAGRLNELVETIYSETPDAFIIVLGDFNDDPFAHSLSYHFPATRDRGTALGKKLFYNPFWRHMGESEPHAYKTKTISVGGSYFYRSGRIERWRTFDQILFSHSFLNDKSWHLNEKYTAIIRTEGLIRLVETSKGFDHLPVVSVIERQIQSR
jgi:hypothetical protein